MNIFIGIYCWNQGVSRIHQTIINFLIVDCDESSTSADTLQLTSINMYKYNVVISHLRMNKQLAILKSTVKTFFFLLMCINNNFTIVFN